MKAVSGIYKLTCIESGKAYIGKTEGIIEDRADKHLDGKTPGCRALHSAIQKYGKENFKLEILEQNVIPELLSDLEMFYIAKFNTISPHGYNLTEGGETGHHSEETIKKRAETLRANPPMLGKNHTPEAKAKMSETRKGRKYSEEHRSAISEGNMGHEVPPETRQKISKANELPQKRRVHKFYFSLPLEMPYREKIEILSTKFSDVKRKTINYWMNEWESHKSLPRIKEEAYKYYCSLPTSLTLKEKLKMLQDKYSETYNPKTIERWARKWKSEISHEPAPHEKGFEIYTSLSNKLTLTEKRTILYDAFPTVKKPTIDTWIRKWTNYKPYKEGSRHSAEYHQTRELLLSLPNEMSIVEKRQYLQENVSGVPRGTISRWVRKWTGTKGRNNPTHPDHDKAHKYFLSLRSDIPLNKRIHLFRKAFPNVSPASRIKWIKKWTGETMPTGSPCHPDRPEIHDYFLSLPLNMPISEKRKRILEKFGDVVGRSLVNRWTHRWHIEITGSPPPDQRWSREPFNHWKKGKPAHNRRPEYDDARDFFFSLPTMIPSKEKSRQLIEKYRHIPRGTIYQWTSRWQSSLANSA